MSRRGSVGSLIFVRPGYLEPRWRRSRSLHTVSPARGPMSNACGGSRAAESCARCSTASSYASRDAETCGQAHVYATSPEFLDTFGLTALSELPSLREFTDLGPEDIDAVRELLSDDPELIQQVTFEEYAARRALARVDAAASERLPGGP